MPTFLAIVLVCGLLPHATMGGHGHEEERDESFIEHLFDLGETASNAGETSESLEGSDLFAGLGLLGGMTSFGAGLAEMIRDPSLHAGVNMAKGAKNAVQAGATLMGAHELAGDLNPVGTVLDGVSAIDEARRGDYRHAARDGVSTVLGATAPEMAAPWKMGWWAGEMAEEAGGAYAAKRDLFGENRTTAEWAGDTGRSVRDAIDIPVVGDVLGGGTSLVLGIGGTAYSGARWLGSEAADGAGWLHDKIFGEYLMGETANFHLDAGPEEVSMDFQATAHDDPAPEAPPRTHPHAHYAD